MSDIIPIGLIVGLVMFFVWIGSEIGAKNVANDQCIARGYNCTREEELDDEKETLQ